MENVKILGINISTFDFNQTIREIDVLLQSEKKGFLVTANPEILYLAHRDKYYQQIIQKADIVTADGSTLLRIAKIKGKKIPERITGIDLTWALLKLAEDRGYRVFLLGGEPANEKRDEIAKTVAFRVKKIHPNLNIVGATFGFWKSLDKASVLADAKSDGQDRDPGLKEKVMQEIQHAKPNIIFVAFGAPMQEKWIAENLDKFSTPCIAIGVGGTFDIIAGKLKRAPGWMQKSGLEWLWRVIQEPSRIPRLWNVIKFIFLALTK